MENKSRSLVAASRLVPTLSVFLPLWAAGLGAQERGEGPASLFLTYQCGPDKRPAFRAHMAGPGGAHFARWKKEGVYRDSLLLFSSFVNTGEFDLLVRLDFERYADIDKWKAIERTMPGGMSPEALALCSPTTAYLADLAWHGGPTAERSLKKAVYLVIPYHFEKGIGKPIYKKYFEAYVKPQNDGWIAEMALSWWGVYLNQHNTGRPWDVLFLYEYQDIVGLARRDNVKEAVRKRLADDPGWKTISDNKQSFRIEDQVIIADVIPPPE